MTSASPELCAYLVPKTDKPNSKKKYPVKRLNTQYNLGRQKSIVLGSHHTVTGKMNPPGTHRQSVTPQTTQLHPLVATGTHSNRDIGHQAVKYVMLNASQSRL